MKILPCGIAVLEGDLWASRWIEEQGRLDYDPTISQVLEPMLKPGDTAIDVGAMLGAYSFGFKRAVGPTGRVISFEPNEEAYKCLAHNCPDVEYMHFGLSDAEENMTSAPDESNPGKFKLKPWRTLSSHYAATVYPLDAFFSTHENYYNPLASLNLLKIDVEGMEPKVIAGGIETIKRFRPIIFIEINHAALGENGFNYKDVIGPLQEIGYVPRHLKEGITFNSETHPEIDVLMIP